MEGTVNISVYDFENLRQTESLYLKTQTTEFSIIEYPNTRLQRGDRFIVTNDCLMKELIEKNNNFAKILNDQNREIYSLKTNQHQIVYPKPSQIEIKGFWKRLDWLLNGKVK